MHTKHTIAISTGRSFIEMGKVETPGLDITASGSAFPLCTDWLFVFLLLFVPMKSVANDSSAWLAMSHVHGALD